MKLKRRSQMGKKLTAILTFLFFDTFLKRKFHFLSPWRRLSIKLIHLNHFSALKTLFMITCLFVFLIFFPQLGLTLNCLHFEVNLLTINVILALITFLTCSIAEPILPQVMLGLIHYSNYNCNNFNLLNSFL